MKNITTKTICILLLSASLFSCRIGGFNKVSGNRNVVKEERDISSDFTKIKVGQGISVFLTMGEKTFLEVEADENLLEIIKTEVENGILRIYTEENIWKAKSKKIHITAPNVNAIVASSGSHVSSENTLITDSFSIKSSSGSRVDLMLNTENVDSNASSGSSIKISGKTFSHTANASSGSFIKSLDLKGEQGNAKVSSGAHIKMNTTEKLTARASSGGSIRYSGNPKNTDKKSSSGGNIYAH